MKFVRRPRFDIRQLGGVRIRHLLIVSGPTGSGKSTFIEQLADGDLPGDVERALPSGAPSWPHTNGTLVVRSRFHIENGDGARPSLPGLVLHFDILRPFETERTYESDEAMAIARLADKITVVTIRPSIEQLVEQINRRTRIRLLTRGFKRLRRSLGISSQGRRSVKSHLRHEKLAAMYTSAGFVDAWDRQWRDFLMTRFSEKLTGPALVLEPTPGQRRKSFRLASAHSPLPYGKVT